MSLPLAEDEEVELELHPHWKALVLPVIALVVTCGAASFLTALLPHRTDGLPLWYVVAALAVAAVVAWTVTPYLRWRGTLFVLTTHRIVTREGILSRHGRSVPLSRVTDVSFSRTLLERLLGCGTLVVESAGDNGRIVLDDVPRVELVQTELYRLVDADSAQTRHWHADEDRSR